MNRTTVALTATFGAVALGLTIPLISEIVDISKSFVVVDGIVALVGVDVLTGVMMRLPNPNEGEHGSDDDHA